MEQHCAAQIDFDLIKSIAERMRNPSSVKEIVLDPKNKNPDPLYILDRWSDLSIAGGYPGILPLFVELDKLFPEEKWDLVAHDYILSIVDSIKIEGINSLTLFNGLAGICFYIKQASKNEQRYKKVLDKLDDYLLKGILISYINPFNEQLNQSTSCSPRLYELIQGLSGIGIYCLINKDKPEFQKIIHRMIQSFISLTHPIKINGKIVPGWHVASESIFFEKERIRCPNGNFNLGLSHGITGVLAFLSIAMLHGIEQEGQKNAIETIARWIQTKRKSINNRFFWDGTITFEEEISGSFTIEHKTKDAWCYGTPGVARTLYLAGMALKDNALQEFALEAFLSIFKSSREEWNLPNPMMCHGISGLLIITQLMARDSQSPILIEEVEKLREILLSYYNPSFPFGFKQAESLKNTTTEYAWVDQVDVLEGVSGVLLTLLSLHAKNFQWHLPFLIDFL